MNQLFTEHKFNFFDIELTNRCALKCPRCPRTQDPITKEKRDLNLDFFKFAFPFKDTKIKSPTLAFQGTYGDSIYHPEFLEIVRYFKENFDAKIHLTTNGSGKNEIFWHELSSILDRDDYIEFSIDGLKETNHYYRVGAQWDSIQKAISATVGIVKTIWKLVYFSHNEEHIDHIREYAFNLGVDEFLTVKSKRFNDFKSKPDPLRPTNNDFVSASTHNRSLIKNLIKSKQQISDEKITSLIHLNPYCLSNQTTFITYDGHLSPCCTSGIYKENVPRFPFISEKELLELSDLRLRPIEEVMLDPRWNIFDQLNNQNLRHCDQCYKRCGLHLDTDLNPAQDPSYIPSDRSSDVNT